MLKRGGSIYFDAPIHLHGHEMFVLGDLGRIRGSFDETLWTDVLIEKWRYDHDPLPKCLPPLKEIATGLVISRRVRPPGDSRAKACGCSR